jgi:hypothetical protein
MYYAFASDFMNQWNNPVDVEKKRKQEEENKQKFYMKMNIESLEKCIHQNAIENLDRTKSYDKTFICSNFISTYGNYIGDDKEMKNLVCNMEQKINELGIKYTDKTTKILTTEYTCSKMYKYWSNVIPKNTFTNIGTSLVFRISNNMIEDNQQIKSMEHTSTYYLS